MHLHKFKESDKPGYDICDCGTYHSRGWKNPAEIYDKKYWSGKRPKLRWQFNNVAKPIDGVSKVSKILKLISPNTNILEIGCAPGLLMSVAKEALGCNVVGIEPDATVIRQMKKWDPFLNIVQGYFPNVIGDQLDVFDYIIALDILEHIPDYMTFIDAAYACLRKNGQFIFMSPIIYPDGRFRLCDFEVPHEHIWIFSQQYLKTELERKFTKVSFDRWIVGHEVVICSKCE